jgi:hypothetical protein
MPVAADLAVGTEQGDAELAGLGHEETIGGIGVERFRQACGSHGDGEIQNQKAHGRMGGQQRQPALLIQAESKPSPVHQHCHLPAADRRHQQPW